MKIYTKPLSFTFRHEDYLFSKATSRPIAFRLTGIPIRFSVKKVSLEVLHNIIDSRALNGNHEKVIVVKQVVFGNRDHLIKIWRDLSVILSKTDTSDYHVELLERPRFGHSRCISAAKVGRKSIWFCKASGL